MKLNCGPTRWEKRQAKFKWHFWFAWYPVRITGTHTCIWLKYIPRKGIYNLCYDSYWVWEYCIIMPLEGAPNGSIKSC